MPRGRLLLLPEGGGPRRALLGAGVPRVIQGIPELVKFPGRVLGGDLWKSWQCEGAVVKRATGSCRGPGWRLGPGAPGEDSFQGQNH